MVLGQFTRSSYVVTYLNGPSTFLRVSVGRDALYWDRFPRSNSLIKRNRTSVTIVRALVLEYNRS